MNFLPIIKVCFIPNRDIFIIIRYNIVKVFPMRLRQLRKEKNLSQLKLAIDLNMNQNTISRYETGEREAGYLELIAIADYFQVSIDYLLERSDDRTFK